MDPTLTALLLCPVCGERFEIVRDGQRDSGLQCTRGHRFDRAKYGYVNLLTGRASGFVPDSAAMVDAREAVLGAGHYRPLAQALERSAQTALAHGHGRAVTIFDAGAGTGYYLHALLAGRPGARAIAMDLSTFALRRAARRLPQALSLAWDIWRPLPVKTGSIDLIVNIFAPRNTDEFSRILAPEGRLLVVTPGAGHLEQLRRLGLSLAVDEDKEEQLTASLDGRFTLENHEMLSYPMTLKPEDVRHLAMMGPAAHHVDEAALTERVGGLAAESTVTASFRISRFIRR